MAVLEFAGFAVIIVCAFWAVTNIVVRLHEKHVEWKYQLEKRKRDDEQNYRLIDGDKNDE